MSMINNNLLKVWLKGFTVVSNLAGAAFLYLWNQKLSLKVIYKVILELQ